MILKTLKWLLFVLLPSVFVMSIVLLSNMGFINNDEIAIAFIYLLTIFYLVIFIKYKLTNISALPLGFLFSSFPYYLYELYNPSLFGYLGTIISFLFYSLPCFVVSLLAITFIYIKKLIKDKTN